MDCLQYIHEITFGAVLETCPVVNGPLYFDAARAAPYDPFRFFFSLDHFDYLNTLDVPIALP